MIKGLMAVDHFFKMEQQRQHTILFREGYKPRIPIPQMIDWDDSYNMYAFTNLEDIEDREEHERKYRTR